MTAYQKRTHTRASNEKGRTHRKYTFIDGIRVTNAENMLSPPTGCIDVWQISAYVGSVYRYFGIFKTFDEALERARVLKHEGLRDCRLSVQHKAAIELTDGKFHLVHFHPIKWSNENAAGHEEEDSPDQDPSGEA